MFQHAVTLYSPAGIHATWDGEDSWSTKLRHNQSELIDSLSVRIDDCALQLNHTSGSLLLPYNEFACKLKLPKLVFSGPHTGTYSTTMYRIKCASFKTLTGISLSLLLLTKSLRANYRHISRGPIISPQTVFQRVAGMLPPSRFRPTKPSSSTSMGKTNFYTAKACNFVANFGQKPVSLARRGGCPLCHSKTHSFLSCPVLETRGPFER